MAPFLFDDASALPAHVLIFFLDPEFIEHRNWWCIYSTTKLINSYQPVGSTDMAIGFRRVESTVFVKSESAHS